jgi:4-aminobutyrate aminotransferase / (S)-3-amino-2-methylpropionate transaminase / 5-aminovalerate transaminase
VLVITAGPAGNVIRILSPLVITDEELDRGLDVIEEAVLLEHREAPRRGGQGAA